MLVAVPNFRWRGRLYHLTYKGHIDDNVLRAKLDSICSIKVMGTSCVHEASDADAPYDHTHFAWMWERAVDLVGCDKMDIRHSGAIVHPNIESKKSVAWMEHLFLRYHRGHKTGADGKDKFVPPVDGPWQQLPQSFQWSEYIVTEVESAPGLIEGVFAAGIRPTRVSDVLLLQQHKRPAPFEHNFPPSAFLPQVLPQAFVTRVVGTLHIYGAIRLGKTEWACAQFSNPLYVTSRDQLRGFRPHIHDGIVTDKMLFNEWSVVECESLTDWTQPAAISCRYGIATIPKHTPKIVVTNERDAWPSDPHGQLLGRRIAQMHVTARMY
jgi:hypothetical protein